MLGTLRTRWSVEVPLIVLHRSRDRVLCIFTTGQAWQFKPYKYQEPKELFKRIPGIYFRLTSEQVHPGVKDWNVREFKVCLAALVVEHGSTALTSMS